MALEPLARDIDLSTGLRMRYYEWRGEGPTLILLHTSSGYGRMWDYLASHLHTQFHIYTPDQRGHGDSSGPDGGYTAEEYAEDLRAFMEALGIEQAVLAGHSLGGRVAQVFAAMYPRRTQAILLVGGPHYVSFFQEAPLVDATLQGADHMRTSSEEFANEKAAIGHIRERYPSLSEEVRRHRLEHNFDRFPGGSLRPKYDRLRVAQGLTHIPDNLSRYARQVTCPVAFIIGTNPSHLTRSQADRVAQCYSKTEVDIHEVKGDYFLELENPEGLARAIQKFLALRVPVAASSQI